MTLQEFIDKAIENGYDGYHSAFCEECGNYEPVKSKYVCLFLDPNVWEAVTKDPKSALLLMHKMINALYQGQSITDFIGKEL